MNRLGTSKLRTARPHRPRRWGGRAGRTFLGTLLALVGLALLGPVPVAHGAAATQVRVDSVSDPVAPETLDEFVVRALDGNGQIDQGYTGTVTFSSNCPSTCFGVTLAGSAGSITQYTFMASDNGFKAFNLVWLTTAVGERTFTVTGTLAGGAIDSDTVADITVQFPPTTTTSTSSTSSTSTSSTSSTTSTTTTTIPQRGPGSGPAAIRAEGVLAGGPDAAAVRGVERVDVVVKRGSPATVQRTVQVNFGPWQQWQDLGVPSAGIKGDPTIVSWAPGRLDVFVRGGDDRLWHRYSQDGGSTFVDWYRPFADQGIALASSPNTSSRGPDRLDVYFVGSDGQVYERFWENVWNHAYLPHGAPSGGVVGDPTSVSWGDGARVDLFVRGSDNRLWQRSLVNWNWTAWARPVGDRGTTLTSSPDAASWAQGVLLVFARGADGRAYILPFGGAWGDWIFLAGSDPRLKDGARVGATSRGGDRFDMFVQGTNDLALHIWQ